MRSALLVPLLLVVGCIQPPSPTVDRLIAGIGRERAARAERASRDVPPSDVPRTAPEQPDHEVERDVDADRFLSLMEQDRHACQIGLMETYGRIDPYYEPFDDCWRLSDIRAVNVERLIAFEDFDLEKGCVRDSDDGMISLCEILTADGHQQIVEECQARSRYGPAALNVTAAVLCIENTHRELLRRAVED